MAQSLVSQTITIANITFSYEDLIVSSGLADVSANKAAQYLAKYHEPKQAAKHLIRSFKTQYIMVGLAANLPDEQAPSQAKKLAAATGVLLEILMCLSVANLAGFSAYDDEVKSFVMGNTVISAASKALQPYAVEFGSHLAEHLIDCIPQEVIYDVNDAAGYRAITKYGETGTINLDDWAWLGGLGLAIGADFCTSSFIGWNAYRTFFKKLSSSEIKASCTEKDTNN